MTAFSRRRFLGTSAVLFASTALPLRANTQPKIHVAKDPDCGCCEGWVNVLKAEGFEVTVEIIPYDELQAYKARNGVPYDLASCHTALIDGYVIEGHVPVADIRRLLQERPDAIGLSVPGMVYGSPGMGPEDQRDAYDVLLIGKDGRARVFTRYDAA